MILAISISIIGLLFLLVNAIIFYSTKKGKESAYQFLTFYLILLFLIEVLCHYIGITKPNSNFFLSHYYFNAQFILLSCFFYHLFEEKWMKMIVRVNVVLIFLILGFQYTINTELYWKFNPLEIGLTSSILLAYCCFHFYKHLKSSYKYFYFCLGIVFYLSCSMFIFLTGNTSMVFFKEPFYFDIWLFNSLFYLFFQYLIYKEWVFLNRKEFNEVVL